MECTHKDFATETIEKEIFDLKFKYKTQVCKDCGAHLRDSEFEKTYMHWLEGVYKDRRDKFQVQCTFSSNLIKCADNFLEDYPGISSTVLMRFLVTVYLNVVDVNENLSSKLDSLLDAQIYDSFLNDKDKKKVNIQFKPNMMLDLVAISEVIDMKPYQIVETAVLKMMTAITSQDKKLREFWEKEIRTYLDIFLKAV
ncbi:MAG: hypothetical protein HYV97_05105 [Bdellovibrio sp.]|nr:hypothetical protein [Bdellovibrio sp.]